MRLPSSKAAAQQRSINLAISARGIAAIEAIQPSAADRFLKAVIPMRGRMIHHVDGQQESQTYDRDGQVRFTSLLTSAPVAKIDTCNIGVPRAVVNFSPVH